MINHADVVIIGAGIVGLSTAMSLGRRFQDLRVIVVEAEGFVGRHQSGHNSGVLHSGAYYKPNSKKALTCRAGKLAMEAFCDQHQIAWDRCGKVIVATNEAELPRLDSIADRATENGVAFERIDAQGLRQLEPAAFGLAALHVPETGIVDYGNVCRVMSGVITDQGNEVRLEYGVASIDRVGASLNIQSVRGDVISCGRMINCAGLQSDRVFELAGGRRNVRIVPFRGEYYELIAGREDLCRNLIYPVPDPSFPFLGVHFTRMIGGGVECGPNAVLALSRAGYRWRDINPRDLGDAFSFIGFRKMMQKHWRKGLGEMHRSLSKAAFVTALQKLIPSIREADLKRGRAGVRAQAVTAEGEMVDDFLIEESDFAIHVLNAPSPAATASLAIADQIVDRFAN